MKGQTALELVADYRWVHIHNTITRRNTHNCLILALQILWWNSNCLCSSNFLKEGQALMVAWGGGITWLLMITMLSNLLPPLQRWTINVPCVSSTKSKWRRSGLPRTTSQLSLVAFHHYLNKEMNQKKCHAREKLATLSSQYFLTCEEERGVTCKSVISCHDLHSKLKIETCKTYSIVFLWNFVLEKNNFLLLKLHTEHFRVLIMEDT